MIFQTLLHYLFPKKLDRRGKSKKEDKNILLEERALLFSLKKNPKIQEHTIGVFRIQNLLNEVYGLLEPLIEANNIEFLYDIHDSVPIELVGDTLALEQIFYQLISVIMESQSDSTIIISFKKISNQIHIEIIAKALTKKVPTHSKTVQRLITDIQGELSVSHEEENILYTLRLPFLNHELYQENYYQIPTDIVSKNVLLIEDHAQTKEVITNIFKQFKLNITSHTSDALHTLKNFESYDILILDAKLITPPLLKHLENIKKKHTLHIISLETLYGLQIDRRKKTNDIVSKYLYKPLSRGIVSGLLHDLFVLKRDTNIILNDKTKQEHIQHTGQIVSIDETPNVTRESFKDFGYKHVLLVEDNMINQKIVQSLLALSHINITLASHGQEALDILKDDTSIDLILMDINMPTMDGYQATKHIRKDSTLKDMPIVIISGLGFRNEIKEMYKVGADAHLTKPFKIGELYTALNIFIYKKSTEEDTSMLASDYTENRDILDVTKAMDKVQNAAYYNDSLAEVLYVFKYSDHIIKEYIIRHQHKELEEYCKKLFNYTRSIEAKNLNHLLKEMIVIIKNKEETLLQTYITQYHDTWIKTQRNIKQYLNYTDAS